MEALNAVRAMIITEQLRATIDRLDEAVQLLVKGDLPGHEFRGNQWSESSSGSVGSDADSGELVYHATAIEYAQSIMKSGLRTSGKGCPKGVYASLDIGEAFAYGTNKAVEEFQKGVADKRYKPEDSKNVKVMLIVASKQQFPEQVYQDERPTIFRSKDNVPSSAMKRIEVYDYKAADRFRKVYENAKVDKRPLPKMPPPKPLEVIYRMAKAKDEDLFLCFGMMEKD